MISIGQSVHYVARGSADGVYPPVCRAAVVTAVPEDDEAFPDSTFLSLAIINPTGLFFDTTVIDDNSGEKIPGTWHWACGQ